MLTLWAIFNVVFSFDACSVLAETTASYKLCGEAPSAALSDGLRRFGGSRKTWRFKACFALGTLVYGQPQPFSFIYI